MTSLVNTKDGSGKLNKRLASYLLSLDEGDQILSARQLAKLCGVSLGSISSTINLFEEMGAVKINWRGRLGSFLESKSIGALWDLIENGPMVIALTLPSFPKCEGLATAIYSMLNEASIETYLIFLRGSVNRIKALRQGRCHGVIISALAADELCTEEEQVVLKLPANSFVDEHRVFFRPNRDPASRPLTVGYDPDSFDHKFLTELEFTGDVVFQPMTFTQIDLHLEDSPVDAAVTNGDFLERLLNKEFISRPLSPKVKSLVGDRHTSAALVIRAGESSTKVVLQEILDTEKILEIQQQVMNGAMVPRY
jgi:hypothetical protein